MTGPRKVAVRLWPYIALTLFVLMLWDGLAYLLDPPGVPHAAPGQIPNDPWVQLRQIPGGLRAHGIVLLGCALLLLMVLASRAVGRWQKVALTVITFYAATAAYSMAAAWWTVPDPVWTSPSKWAVLAVLTIGLILSPRDPRKG